MKKLRSMKGSGTLIVTISAIVFLIYATSTFSDVKHLKYMQEKYEEDIKELYENDLKLIDLDATDELNIDYEIKLYNTNGNLLDMVSVSVERIRVYITLNVEADNVIDIKYVGPYYPSEDLIYDESYFETDGKSIKDTYNVETNQYELYKYLFNSSYHNGYKIVRGGTFNIYVKYLDEDGVKEKIISICIHPFLGISARIICGFRFVF